MEVIGWIGAICFALCSLPQAYKSYKDKHSDGVSWGLLSLWGIGEICTLIYIIPKGHVPLIFNYLANIVGVAIIVYYKVKGKNEKR